jgi:hypothetical protein
VKRSCGSSHGYFFPAVQGTLSGRIPGDPRRHPVPFAEVAEKSPIRRELNRIAGISRQNLAGFFIDRTVMGGRREGFLARPGHTCGAPAGSSAASGPGESFGFQSGGDREKGGHNQGEKGSRQGADCFQERLPRWHFPHDPSEIGKGQGGFFPRETGPKNAQANPNYFFKNGSKMTMDFARGIR